MSGRALDALIAPPPPRRSRILAAIFSESAAVPARFIGAILHNQNKLPDGVVASFIGRMAASSLPRLSTGEQSVAQICAIPLSLRSFAFAGPSNSTTDFPE